MLKGLEWLAIIASLALILSLVGVAYLSSPPPGHPREQQASTQTKDKQEAEEQHSIRGFVRYLFPDGIAVFTFFLVVATIVLGVIAIVQIGFLERAENIASQSARAAKEAADATRDAVILAKSTAERQLRAYIFLSDSKISNVLGIPKISIRIKNFGQTPAYQMSFWTEGILREHPLVGDLVRRNNIDSPRMELGPTGALATSIDWDGPITEEDKVDLRNRTKAIYFFGRIDYSDAFGNKWFTEFRFTEGGEFPLRPEGGDLSHTKDGNKAT